MPQENELEDDSVVVEVPENEDDGSEEVKIDDGSVDSSEEEDKPVQRKKRKRGNDAQKAIKEQWKKVQDAERARQEAEALAANEAQRAKTFEGITENALTDQFRTARELAMYKLRDAKAREDIEEETKIMAEISELDAQAAQLKRYKIENETRKEPVKPQREETQNEPVDSFDAFYKQSPPATRKFMDENKSWLDQNSEDYDEEKTQDVIAYGANLEKELIAQGRAAEIGTIAYYKKLNKYIKENWDDNEMEDESEDEAPVKKTFGKQPNAAPVGGRAPSGTKEKQGSVRLSKEEVSFALSLPLKHPNGRDYSDDEKLKAHALSKRNTPESGAITINSRRR